MTTKETDDADTVEERLEAMEAEIVELSERLAAVEQAQKTPTP
jgi:uncharacterized protein YceH (UPF0502 family)